MIASNRKCRETSVNATFPGGSFQSGYYQILANYREYFGVNLAHVLHIALKMVEEDSTKK